MSFLKEVVNLLDVGNFQEFESGVVISMENLGTSWSDLTIKNYLILEIRKYLPDDLGNIK